MDGVKTAIGYAGTALDALALVYCVRLSDISGDCTYRAVLCAQVAADAVLRVDCVAEH